MYISNDFLNRYSSPNAGGSPSNPVSGLTSKQRQPQTQTSRCGQI